MERFTSLTAIAAPMLRQNVDTDLIIRIDRLIGSRRVDLGQFCLEALRYRPDGTNDPGFILNRTPYDRAEILLAGPNFGCGSSREPAVWALMDMGFRAVVAPSFGDIFHNNCFQNGLLPVVLPAPAIEVLAGDTAPDPARRLVTVDLLRQEVTSPGGRAYPFSVDPLQRQGLLEGLDSVGLTLRREDDIAAFQKRDRHERPWAY
ncbi:3-isopropylmalate dehydratase small subunit [Streptomyces sp. NBC_00075]|uniref:3-isopropylmalate dehydratase small subunit n=1 Tax=Streptomyces sp. NBC_00075 TaxID=2975641 RepID=UPI00324D9C0B